MGDRVRLRPHWGVFSFPAELVVVLQDEKPVKERGYLNGRIGSTVYTVGDPVFQIQVERDARTPHWATFWNGEALWAIADVEMAALRFGDCATFAPGSVRAQNFHAEAHFDG